MAGSLRIRARRRLSNCRNINGGIWVSPLMSDGWVEIGFDPSMSGQAVTLEIPKAEALELAKWINEHVQLPSFVKIGDRVTVKGADGMKINNAEVEDIYREDGRVTGIIIRGFSEFIDIDRVVKED